MNISGVNPAASVSVTDLSANIDSSANVAMAASIQVLDMAQDVFSDVADRLLAEMASLLTGVGQNIDITI